MIGPSSQCWQLILAIDFGPMIDRGLDDKYGPILAPETPPIIGRELLPELGGGGEGLTGEKNHFFYEFFSKLSFKYKYLNVSHVTKHHLKNIW